MKLLAKPLMAPHRKPASGPKAIPVSMTMASMGLKWGTAAKAARLPTARAHSTARMTNSRAWGFLLSKCRKKAAMVSKMTVRPDR